MSELVKRGLLAITLYALTIEFEDQLVKELNLQATLKNSLDKLHPKHDALAVNAITSFITESEGRMAKLHKQYWSSITGERISVTKDAWDEAVKVASEVSAKLNFIIIDPLEVLENIHRENSVFTMEQEEAFKVLCV